MKILTLTRTLYFNSSGDGNLSKSSNNGFDNRRSMTNDQLQYCYARNSILPLKVSFKIRAMTPCCAYEQ
jgi:hypothetical protein